MIPQEKNGDSVGKGNGKEEYSAVGRWGIPLAEEGHSVVGEGGLNGGRKGILWGEEVDYFRGSGITSGEGGIPLG
jgi:hypothetical protein